MMFVPQACAAYVKESVVGGVQTMHRIVEDKFHDGYGKTLHIRLLDDVISSINGWYMERGLFGLSIGNKLGMAPSTEERAAEAKFNEDGNTGLKNQANSRDIAMGPVAVVSLLLGTLLRDEVEPKTPEYLCLAFTATFFAGVTQAALGFFRLGFLIDFLSHAAIVGFMGGVVVTIALQQLKGLLGNKDLKKD
ncbi:putative SLC26A/SulP transporter [Helianthus annuus]|nr:putative SLC26A/SulP transporter [Helianthus annuus]